MREIVAIAREMEALQLALGVHVVVGQHLRRGRSVRACAYTAISRAARYPQPRVRRVLHGVQRGVRLERRELVHRVACVHALHCRYTSPIKYSRWCQWRLYASNMRHCILAKFRASRILKWIKDLVVVRFVNDITTITLSETLRACHAEVGKLAADVIVFYKSSPR